jgi:hypothetical protein
MPTAFRLWRGGAELAFQEGLWWMRKPLLVVTSRMRKVLELDLANHRVTCAARGD